MASFKEDASVALLTGTTASSIQLDCSCRWISTDFSLLINFSSF